MEIIKIVRCRIDSLNYYYYFKTVQARICYLCFDISGCHDPYDGYNKNFGDY